MTFIPTVIENPVRPLRNAIYDPDRKIDPFKVHDPDCAFDKILPLIADRGVQDGTGPLSLHVTLA
jgi:hypothetical protein